MDKEIKLILNNCHLPTVEVALEIVNLKKKERDIIELFELKGYTAEDTAEKLNLSVKTIYNLRNSAFLKMRKAWTKEGILEKLMEG